jgi:hypothetical protein
MYDFTNKFPFPSKLNLRLLVEYWEHLIQETNAHEFTKGVLEYIQSAPELKQPIEDASILEKHRSFIDYMMSAVVPTASDSKDLVAAIYPFTFKALFTTSAFDAKIDLSKMEEKAKANLPGESMVLGKVIKGCLMVLEKFYNVGSFSDRPVLFSWRDEVTGLDKVYKVEIDHQFCEIIHKGPVPHIDRQVVKFLMEKTYDIDLWFQYIHPEKFEFQGFIVLRLVDVTEQEMLSSIKYDLLEKNAVVSKATFSGIQHKLRSLFGIPEIRLGIAYFDPNNNLILNSDASDCWKSLADSPHPDHECGDYSGSIYERSWMEKRYITIENLTEYPFQSKVEKALIDNGVNNILLAPLIDEEETIGMLELATPIAGKLNSISAHKVENVLPMFTAAVKRVKEEMSTEVRAIIQEECTAIHPTVQWRFFEAGVRLMNRRRRGEHASFEEIVFKDVYPLYGMADVRNSSVERNKAIQLDLQQNLELVKDLLMRINLERRLPLLDEVIYKTEGQLKRLSRGLASGDESSVLDFLRSEIDPLIVHFGGDAELAAFADAYKANLDPVSGVVYRRRKAFEESLEQINRTISDYLDEAEKNAQKMFPHYFEKYKTDGVEYSLYVGDELVRDKKFDPFYLKNFHLWQLLTMCEIHQRIETLKPSLRTKLDITQLILIHNQPISIRFRSDEKQFDVDGAYDIRYEIVKKRIDKAFVKNTNERLTQPGKIAIVYNQARVEDEFRRYFQYLKARNLVTGKVEELELEELPGATGLRALRFELTSTGAAGIDSPSSEPLLKQIQEGLRV